MATGTVCAAQFSYNGSWYRGRVLEVKGEESQIQFLDYGNVEWVPNHLVQPIDPTTLEVRMCLGVKDGRGGEREKEREGGREGGGWEREGGRKNKISFSLLASVPGH